MNKLACPNCGKLAGYHTEPTTWIYPKIELEIIGNIHEEVIE